MNSEEQPRKLSLRVTAAPEDSEEFKITMDELRTGPKNSAERGRQKIKALKSALPPSDDRLAVRSRAQPQKKSILKESMRPSRRDALSAVTISSPTNFGIDSDHVRCPKCLAAVIPWKPKVLRRVV
jgi:hypothetical protein